MVRCVLSYTTLHQSTVVRGILPFFTADLVRPSLLILFPALALWLPARMVG